MAVGAWQSRVIGQIVAEGGVRVLFTDDSSTTHRHLATEIVAAFVRRNRGEPGDIGSLISTVYHALTGLDGPPQEAIGERTPAVSIRRSIMPTSVICLDCGWRGQMLRRHLTAAHGLTTETDRARWNLPRDHAMPAPAYSEPRSAIAKQLGLGRGRRSASA